MDRVTRPVASAASVTKRVVTVVAASLALVNAATVAQARRPGGPWITRDLGTLGGTNSWAIGVDRKGTVIVGASEVAHGDAFSSHATLWTESGIIDLGIPEPGGWSWLSGISNNGRFAIGGFCTPYPGPCRATVWTPHEGITVLGTLGGLDSYATGVTDQGVVAGYSSYTHFDRSPKHAFVWTRRAGMRDLGTLGGDYSEAWSINRKGVIGGWTSTSTSLLGFVWTPRSGVLSIGTAGGRFSFVTAVSDTGLAVGRSEAVPVPCGPGMCFDNHAVAWSADNGLVDLHPAGWRETYASAVNNAGTMVVGSGYQLGSSYNRALAWTPEGPIDLGTLGLSGEAYAVNDDGLVIGGGQTADYFFHAFAWTKGEGLVDLTPGPAASAANGLSENGVIVGTLCPSTIPGQTPTPCHATVWRRAP
jgi:probable HAF family extracellular repeat protein